MKKQLKLAIFLFILVGFNSRGVIFTSNGQDKSGESSLNEFKRYQDGVDSKSNRKSPCSSNTRTITDMFGRDVEITSEVSRIVTTGAGALRLVIYMNGTDKVVGVENIERDEEVDPELDMRPYNLAHPEIRELPSIGPIWGGDKELIVDVNPEVVITTNEEQASDLDSLQDSLNVPVIGLIYGDLDESLDFLWEALNITARVLGTYERFTEFKTNLEDIFADLNSRTSNIENVSRPSVYVAGVSHRGSHGIESTKPGYDPFNLVNADNVADELDADHAFVDKEQVLAWDPDIIFLDG